MRGILLGLLVCAVILAANEYQQRPAPPPDGTFISDGRAIYVMERGARRGFPDPDTYLAWGGPSSGVGVVGMSPEQIRWIPEGPPIPQGSTP